MSSSPSTFYLLVLVVLIANLTSSKTSPSPSPQPVFQPVAVPAETSTSPQPQYVPHATFPFADTYPEGYPYYSVQPYSAGPISGYMGNYLPAPQTVYQGALRVFSKIGVVLVGAVSFLVIGGLFATIICALTPFCTLNYDMGLAGLDKATVRSLMDPDNISTAAALVQDAIGKYNRLQRSALQSGGRK